jgi:hypothetical protein
MPISDTFSLTKITIAFFDELGNYKDEIETLVYELEKAEELYDTALKAGKTATLSEVTR